MEVAEYVLQDRSTADKWALSIADGELTYSTTSSSSSSEPIFEDSLNAETYWKLFSGGAAIAYMATSFVSSGNNTGPEQIAASSTNDVISEIVDTIKTGQPSF